MGLNIPKEVGAMKRMTTRQLKDRYEEVFGEVCRSNHKQWLIKRIAWRLQANEEGDLSERARQRATELANDADLRMKAPPKRKATPAPAARKVTGSVPREHDVRVPMPGTIIIRRRRECRHCGTRVTTCEQRIGAPGDGM